MTHRSTWSPRDWDRNDAMLRAQATPKLLAFTKLDDLLPLPAEEPCRWCAYLRSIEVPKDEIAEQHRWGEEEYGGHDGPLPVYLVAAP